MVAFKILLDKEQYSEFHMKVEQLFEDLSQNINTIPIKKVREMMGFPSNWRKLSKLD